jgi:hypothetical protein
MFLLICYVVIDIIEYDMISSTQYRLLEISRAAKSLTPVNQERMKQSYEKLLALTGSAARQAGNVIERWEKGKLRVTGNWLSVEVRSGGSNIFSP